MTWARAGDLRASGVRLPARIPDHAECRVTHGVDRDGQPMRKVETKPYREAESDRDHAERWLLASLTAWGKAIRGRYPKCGLPVACGSTCRLFADHVGGCLCAGSEGGEEECPA